MSRKRYLSFGLFLCLGIIVYFIWFFITNSNRSDSYLDEVLTSTLMATLVFIAAVLYMLMGTSSFHRTKASARSLVFGVITAVTTVIIAILINSNSESGVGYLFAIPEITGIITVIYLIRAFVRHQKISKGLIPAEEFN